MNLFLLVAAWPLLASIWNTKLKQKKDKTCTATVSLPTVSVWGGGRRLEATEHQLLWCNCGWRRSTVTGQIIRFLIPCRDSKCYLLQLAAAAVLMRSSWILAPYTSNNNHRLKSQTTVLLKSPSSASVKLKETRLLICLWSHIRKTEKPSRGSFGKATLT